MTVQHGYSARYPSRSPGLLTESGVVLEEHSHVEHVLLLLDRLRQPVCVLGLDVHVTGGARQAGLTRPCQSDTVSGHVTGGARQAGLTRPCQSDTVSGHVTGGARQAGLTRPCQPGDSVRSRDRWSTPGWPHTPLSAGGQCQVT